MKDNTKQIRKLQEERNRYRNLLERCMEVYQPKSISHSTTKELGKWYRESRQLDEDIRKALEDYES